MTHAHNGMSLREAKKLWKKLGGEYDLKNGGEVVFQHSSLQKPIPHNNRRHDASRNLVRGLKEIDG